MNTEPRREQLCAEIPAGAKQWHFTYCFEGPAIVESVLCCDARLLRVVLGHDILMMSNTGMSGWSRGVVTQAGTAIEITVEVRRPEAHTFKVELAFSTFRPRGNPAKSSYGKCEHKGPEDG